MIFTLSVVSGGGITSKKKEGDKKTPKGIYSLGNIFYRADRVKKPKTDFKIKIINSKMGWCNDSSDEKNYNKLINLSKKIKHEKLFRDDYKYNYIIPILYNTKKTIPGLGSAIFIHLTKNYSSTAGCIALKKRFFNLIKIDK